MKRMLAPLALALTFVAACGSANDSGQGHSLASTLAESSGSADNDVEGERTLIPLQGTIGDVSVHSAPAPALGLWTEVTVDFVVSCTDRLESAVASYEYGEDGQISILASAFASTPNRAKDTMVCQAFSIESAKVILPGIVDKDSLVLVNLNKRNAPQAVPAGTAAVRTLTADDIEIANVRSLCPAEAVCVLGGTVVTLRVTLGSCVNHLAPLAYAAKRTADGFTLNVHAVEFVDENAILVRCNRAPIQTVEVSLPMLFGDLSSVRLHVLQ